MGAMRMWGSMEDGGECKECDGNGIRRDPEEWRSEESGTEM